MKVLARRLACLGSLSCWKRWLCGYALLIKGSTPFVRISERKNLASIVPSKITNFVGPLFEMPAHTCTLRGCFGFPFSLGCSHSRWKLILLWFSSTTLHSSVKMKLPNCSFFSRHFWLNSRRFTRFGSLINWQYFGLAHSHPNFRLRRLIFPWLNCMLNRLFTLLVSSGAVISSFISISASRKSIISTETSAAGRPLHCAFSSDFLSLEISLYSNGLFSHHLLHYFRRCEDERF